MKCYKQSFPLTIQNLNDFANELLRNREANQVIGVNWHLAFFKRYSEVKTKFSRPIDKQRVWAENPDVFIDWFRRFQNRSQRLSYPMRKRRLSLNKMTTVNGGQ